MYVDGTRVKVKAYACVDIEYANGHVHGQNTLLPKVKSDIYHRT